MFKVGWLLSYITMIPATIHNKMLTFGIGLLFGIASIIVRFVMQNNKNAEGLTLNYSKPYQFIVNILYLVFKVISIYEILKRRYFIISIFFFASLLGTSSYILYLTLNTDFPEDPN